MIYRVPNHRWSGKRIALILALLLASWVALSATQTSEAKADNCNPVGGDWECGWFESGLPPSNPRWLHPPNGVYNRNWKTAGVGDLHGGSVHDKCVVIDRQSDGQNKWIACGRYEPVDWVPANMKPGRLFIRHTAPGPRGIVGFGVSP